MLVDPAQKIAERLDATVVNMRFVKPLDEDLIISVAARHRAIVTIEENATAGGAGSAVAELLASEGLQVPLLQLGIPDRFIEHGSRENCLRPPDWTRRASRPASSAGGRCSLRSASARPAAAERCPVRTAAQRSTPHHPGHPRTALLETGLSPCGAPQPTSKSGTCRAHSGAMAP